MPKVL